jgi:NitT/TauT family transport system substrate-binding protein
LKKAIKNVKAFKLPDKVKVGDCIIRYSDVENIVFASGVAAFEALQAGKAEFAMAVVPPSISLWQKDPNFIGITPLAWDTETLLIMAQKGISKPADLKGKRVATFPGITSLALAKAVLRPHFDPNKEVTLIEIPPGNIVQALASGQIDAYFTPEPFGMMAEAKGVGRDLVKHPLQGSQFPIDRGIGEEAF